MASDPPGFKSRSLSFSLIIKSNHQIAKNLPYFCMLLFILSPHLKISYVQQGNDILIFLKPTFNQNISWLKAFNGCPLPNKLRKTLQFSSQNPGLTPHASFPLDNLIACIYAVDHWIHNSSAISQRSSKEKAVATVCMPRG